MQSRPFQLFMLACCTATIWGCASAETTSPSLPPHLPFAEVKASPDSYRGQVVTFGGQVLSARRLKDGTRIEVLQLPLSPSGQPAIELNKSQGRFLAVQREFLDPATIPAGTFVVITGHLTGSQTMPLDETEYHYPMVDITDLQVMTVQEDGGPHLRPYMGAGPYWGPFWGLHPSRRFWPYW